MARFRIFISIIILIAALFLLFDRLFTPQTIQITLQSGQEITTTSPEYFSLSQALLLVTVSFLIGTTSTFLYYNSNGKQPLIPKHDKQDKQETEKKADYGMILPLLKHDERKVITALKEANGEMQQNRLVARLGLSKVKVTRLLYSLEQKSLIMKERYGLTNMVKLRR